MLCYPIKGATCFKMREGKEKLSPDYSVDPPPPPPPPISFSYNCFKKKKKHLLPSYFTTPSRLRAAGQDHPEGACSGELQHEEKEREGGGEREGSRG